jgi:hypothetical protein
MPFNSTVNNMNSLRPSEARDLMREFALLRAELDDIRTKYTALRALLAAATALGAGYNTNTALAATQFTPN